MLTSLTLLPQQVPLAQTRNGVLASIDPLVARFCAFVTMVAWSQGLSNDVREGTELHRGHQFRSVAVDSIVRKIQTRPGRETTEQALGQSPRQVRLPFGPDHSDS